VIEVTEALSPLVIMKRTAFRSFALVFSVFFMLTIKPAYYIINQ